MPRHNESALRKAEVVAALIGLIYGVFWTLSGCLVILGDIVLSLGETPGVAIYVSVGLIIMSGAIGTLMRRDLWVRRQVLLIGFVFQLLFMSTSCGLPATWSAYLAALFHPTGFIMVGLPIAVIALLFAGITSEPDQAGRR